MKSGSKKNRGSIEQYREVLGLADLTNEEIDKIWLHFYHLAGMVYAGWLDQKIKGKENKSESDTKNAK